MNPIKIQTFRAPEGRDAGGRTIAPGLQEIEILTGGRGFFDQGDRQLPVTRGTMLWHLAGERTLYRNDGANPYECLVVVFPWSGELRPVARVSRWSDPGACLSFTEQIVRYYHGEGPDLELLARFVWSTLVWEGRRSDELGPLSPAVRLAQSVLDSQFHQPLTVAALASQAGVSVPHLHALFRKELGLSPHQALLGRRLAEARRLLADSRLSVKQVGHAVGYPDGTAFHKLFKAKCGCTPGDYRERHIRRDDSSF